MCHLNVVSFLDPDNVLFPMVILDIFSFKSVYGLYFTTCFNLVFRWRMFLFWRTKDVLPDVRENILFHFSFCSHFVEILRKLGVHFRILSHRLFQR